MDKKNTKIGTIISADIPQVAGLLPMLGFDFIFVDLEHGSVSDATITSLIIAKQERCKILIRIPEITERAIKHALDLGCDGIIAPRVETIEELNTLVDYCYYPPEGRRGIGLVLANKYGNDMSYTDSFKPIILPQVESTKGLEIANSIAANEKVSGIFLGPYDLSMSLGVSGQFDTEIFRDAYKSVFDACRANNKLFAIFTVDTNAALKQIAKGADMVTVGIDTSLFTNMYAGIIKQLKECNEV